MASIALLGNGRRNSTSSSSSPSFSYTTHSGSNRKLIAFSIFDDSETCNGITINGTALTFVDAAIVGAAPRSYAYFLDEADFPGVGSYTVEASLSSSIRSELVVVELNNCAQGSVSNDDPTTTDASLVIATMTAQKIGAWSVGASVCESVAPTITQTDGTEIYSSTGISTDFAYCVGYRQQSLTGSVGLRHNISATPYDFGLMAVTVDPFVGANGQFIAGAGFV